MVYQEQPIVTPKEVLEKRGIKAKDCFNTDIAILCLRGKTASDKLIENFGGEPIQKKILYHPVLFKSSRDNVLIVPELIWGGPVTAIMIEELYTLGIRKLIGFGAAGSINQNIQPGDMFVAEKVTCIDGTSKEYTNKKESEPNPNLLDLCRNMDKKSDFRFLNGLTTDALYRETPKKIKYWNSLGADFINMDASPFYVVSKMLGIKAIYLGLITDFVGKKWNNSYWSTPNNTDLKIIDYIHRLCVKINE
jgi:uridine phosphorylase